MKGTNYINLEVLMITMQSFLLGVSIYKTIKTDDYMWIIVGIASVSYLIWITYKMIYFTDNYLK